MAATLALSTLFAAAPAMAHDQAHEKAAFPMPAATFKQKVDLHQTKAREHMEKRAAKLSPEEAKELRTKFEAGVAKINAEVSKATADGTVTKEEADTVRKVTHEVRGHHHGKHARRHGQKQPKK
jgi:hypothetical protein